MFSPAFRLLSIVACVAMARGALERGSGFGYALLLAAVVLLVGFWRSGSVWLAWRAFSSGNLRRMERRLAWTYAPRHLGPAPRAYFDFLCGVSLRARGDLEAAHRHFATAVEGRLRSSADRSLVYLHLAEVALEIGDPFGAEAAAARARALGPPPHLLDRLAIVERLAG